MKAWHILVAGLPLTVHLPFFSFFSARFSFSVFSGFFLSCFF